MPEEEEAAAEEVPEEMEFEMELTTPAEYIQCAYFALSSIEDIDEKMQSDAAYKRIKRIRFKSLRIIDKCVNDLYDELFDDGAGTSSD